MDRRFVERVKKSLSDLIGQDVKITVRESSGKDMKTYEGRILRISEDNFEIDSKSPEGKFDLPLQRVHVWRSDDKITFPVKRDLKERSSA